MKDIIIYHGSQKKVINPEIRIAKYTKDFSQGFYCTKIETQTKKWATKKRTMGFVNIYKYIFNQNLNIKTFEEVNEEWLDFVAHCRNGGTHRYDIVEGSMADDTIYNYVERYLEGRMTKKEFLALAKFKYPTQQISFHTLSALTCLKYIESKEVNYE